MPLGSTSSGEGSTFDWLVEQFMMRLVPGYMLLVGVFYFVKTILHTVFIQMRPFDVLNIDRIRTKSFASFWLDLGKSLSLDMPEGAIDVLGQVEGIVLDVGSGSGEPLRFFNAANIRTMYSAEPSVALHQNLRQESERLGLGGKHHILACGAERDSLLPALRAAGLLSGEDPKPVFDQIVCCRVLCGVPRLEETIGCLYELLKPEGKLTVCEHVRNPWRNGGSLISRIAQIFYTMLGWSFFMGGCELNRNTPGVLAELEGGRAWVEERLWMAQAKGAIPWLVGTLTKAPKA